MGEATQRGGLATIKLRHYQQLSPPSRHAQPGINDFPVEIARGRPVANDGAAHCGVSNVVMAAGRVIDLAAPARPGAAFEARLNCYPTA